MGVQRGNTVSILGGGSGDDLPSFVFVININIGKNVYIYI